MFAGFTFEVPPRAFAAKVAQSNSAALRSSS
jgi:hypothetical protein